MAEGAPAGRRPRRPSGIVVIAIVEAVVGVGLILLSNTAFNVYPFDVAETQRLLTDVGVGLMAAAILTGTVEYIANSRHNRELASLQGLMDKRQADLVKAINAQYANLTTDLNERHHVLLEELKVATLDSILHEFVPQRQIVDQIRRHIVEKPFVRENYKVHIRLAWTDDQRLLHKSQTLSYNIVNVSEYPQPCTIRIREDVFLNESSVIRPTFEKVSVRRSKEPSSWVFRDIGTASQQASGNLDQKITLDFDGTSSDASTVRLTFDLVSRQDAFVEADILGLISAKDFYAFNVAIPTTALDLLIEHPEDLFVRAKPLHPEDAFTCVDQSKRNESHWTIAAGLLPFQGVLVEWWPDPTSAAGMQPAAVADRQPQPATE
jgi:hypothetical protein